MKLAFFLHAGKGEPPPELIDLRLCERYHCTPSELDEQDYERIMAHLVCMDVEAQSQKTKQEAKPGANGALSKMRAMKK